MFFLQRALKLKFHLVSHLKLNIMKKQAIFLSIVFLSTILSIKAQDITTVTAMENSYSENLDLEAVASIFGQAENLEDFEMKLNDPEAQISNLDLNGDGQVDYLRVVETSEYNTHLVTIQAVVGRDLYQDVATIDVEKDSNGETQVQVVGDVYMYGPDYIITPVYVRPPVVFTWFWGPRYNPWRSPYYYGYYPTYYRPWRPYPTPRYRSNVHVHVNAHNSYHYTSVRRSRTSVALQNRNRRNDFGAQHPDRSYANRSENPRNVHNGTRDRNTQNARANEAVGANKSTGRQVDKNWKPSSESNRNRSNTSRNAASESRTSTNNRSVSRSSSNENNRSTQQNTNTNRRSSTSTVTRDANNTPSRSNATRNASTTTRSSNTNRSSSSKAVTRDTKTTPSRSMSQPATRNASTSTKSSNTTKATKKSTTTTKERKR